MAKKKKKDDIKNTLLNVASTAKNIAVKSNPANDTNTNKTNLNNTKSISVTRPTTTLANATNKVLSSSQKTSSVQKPVIKAPNVATVSSSSKIQQMSDNSAKWHQAEIQKKLPNANVAALTQKQQELHNQNVKLAGNSLKFNPSGTWQNPISGQKAYDIGTVNQNSVFLPYLPSVKPLKTENTSKVAETPVTSELKLPFDPSAKSVMIGGKEYKIADTARVPSIITSNNKSEIENTLDRARAIAFSTLDTGSKEEAQKLLDTITSNYNDYKGKADDLEQIMYGLNARTQSKLANALNYAVNQTVGSLAALGQTLTKPTSDFISDIGVKEFLTSSGADLQTKYQKGDYEHNAVSADTFAAKELAKAEMTRNNVLRETEGVTRNLAELGLMAVDTAPTLGLSLIPQVGPALSATMVGAKSAGQKAFELQQQGVGATQALQRGLVSGGIDMLTSKFSIDNFLKSFSQKGAKNVIKNILTQAGAEAGDETSSYVLNYLADKAAKDPNATFSVDELSKIAIMSSMLGGLMGGTVSGINTIASKGLNNGQNMDNILLPPLQKTITNSQNIDNPLLLPLRENIIDGQNIDNILFPPLQKTIAEYYLGDAIGDTQNIDSIRQLSTEQFINDDIPAGVPTLRTVAENHINNTLANAKNTQNASVASSQPLPDNTLVNTQNTASTQPLQVPTLRTVAETHINETMAKTQNATKTQSQTVGQIIDNAVANANAKSENMESDTFQDVDTSAMLSNWNIVKALDKQIAEFEERVNFTGNDLRQIESSLLSGRTENIKFADNPQDALYMVELKAKRNAAHQPIAEYNQKFKDNLWNEVAQDADVFLNYAKDKTFGLQYSTETPERNIYDIFGRKYRIYAEDFIKRYYEPVHKAVAKGNKLKNDFRNRVKKLKLNHEESVLTQYLLEGKIDEYNQYIKVKKINLSQKQNAKIDKAVIEFRNIYNEIFSMINQAEIRNGIEPTDFRQNYAPHFSDNLSNHIIARVLNKAGFKITRSDQIPTSISGITEMNKPKRQWFKHLQRRIGDKTIVDAVRGFDQYIDTAVDVITLTDSIQRFRNFEDAIRYKHTDQGMQNAIEKIRNNKTLSYLQKQKKIDEIFENNTSNIERLNNLDGGNMGMRHFVTELRRYTDSLAGKKSRGDRSIEDDIGREIYQISKQTQNRVAADMIAGNMSSWLTNFIPLTQATGEIDLPNLFRGMRDTIKAYGNDDGFVDSSAFLTNRRGSKYLLQTNLQKVGGFLGTPMEIIDHFVADSIVRGRTYQNIDKGLDYDASIDEADAFAASLMADRSKGAMPGIFERQNPITKLFTMFQIEANNQLRYIGKDIYRRLGDYGGQAVATALASIFTTGYIYNNFYQMLTGRRSAFDPMGTIKETVQIVDDPERENSEKIQDVITLYAQQLPFVGGLLGGGRLPIGAVSPNFDNLLQVFNDNVAPEKRKEILIDELSNPIAYLMLPFGGGAAKKAYEGYNMIKNNGAYRMNNKGEEQLMFPAPGDGAKDYLQAMFFGKYSNKNGQNYINNGFQVLSPEYTKRYKRLISDEYGIDNTTAYDALMTVANAPSDEKRTVLMNTPLPAKAKSYLDRQLFSYADSGNGIDYSDQDHFKLTTSVDSDFLQNALYLHDDLGLDTNTVINLINTSSFQSTYHIGSKKDQIFNVLNNIDALNVTDDLKNYAYTEILAPQISEKFTTEQGKQLLEGVPMREAIRSYYMRDIINEEIDNDNTIHQLDKKDYKTLGWQNYLAENALEENMTFEQREKLRYFLSGSQSEFEKTWDNYVYGGNKKERENIEALRNCGLDTLTYQVIKSGISGFKADKDANGEPIDDSKKNKVSAYFKQWNLTDEQYALMMKLQGYKVGSSGSSKKKSSSSKKSSSGSSRSSNKVKGGFEELQDFDGFE